MKSKILTLTIGILIGLIMMYGVNTLTTSSVYAFEELPEEFYTVLYQDHNIRIIEHILNPGEVEPMHNHPPMYAYGSAKFPLFSLLRYLTRCGPRLKFSH